MSTTEFLELTRFNRHHWLVRRPKLGSHSQQHTPTHFSFALRRLSTMLWDWCSLGNTNLTVGSEVLN